MEISSCTPKAYCFSPASLWPTHRGCGLVALCGLLREACSRPSCKEVQGVKSLRSEAKASPETEGPRAGPGS